MTPPPCSLCGHDTSPFQRIGVRCYWRCGACELTQLDASHWLDAASEATEYTQHENDATDPGYRRFLSKVADPLLERLAPASSGLDYGCGPGPALAQMLRETGHSVALYDPFFAKEPALLSETYDFITCTEVAEHFQRPGEEFERLNGMLRPGGWLAVMTCFQTDDSRFATWHYARDPTHVVFYRESTLRRVAERFRWRCEVPVKDVALFQKP